MEAPSWSWRGSTGALVVLLAFVTVSCRPRVVCFPLDAWDFSRKIDAASFDPADIRVVPMASRWDRVVGPGISGAVLPTDVSAGRWGQGDFVPSEEEIRTCEVMIHKALAKEPFCSGQIETLVRHFRHYGGVLLDDARTVVIYLTCGVAALDHGTIDREHGGPCLAFAECEPDVPRLVSFVCGGTG